MNLNHSCVSFISGIQILFIITIIGHILCGISDCLISFTPDGRMQADDMKNYDSMHTRFARKPLAQLELAMLLGFIAMIMEIFGYLALCNWMHSYSATYALIMYISSIVMFMSITVHHQFCCLVIWYFVKQGCSKDAMDAITDFFKKTSYTMIVSYLSMLVFAVTFFIAVVSGITALPRFACIFNLLPLYIVVLPTKLPAQANIIGALMFLGLLFVI